MFNPNRFLLEMSCEYCEQIHSCDIQYPLREATRDLESDFVRCNWHWRYVCDVCGKPTHFNGITWCKSAEKFVCIRCSGSHELGHRLLKGRFWVWGTYYAIGCPYCNHQHPALDRLEFQGEHPRQLVPQMLKEKKGLSQEIDTRRHRAARRFYPEDYQVTDEMVGLSWDKVADLWFKDYDEFGDKNRLYVIDPAIMSVLGEVKGKRILDAGCGNGYLCRQLSQIDRSIERRQNMTKVRE